MKGISTLLATILIVIIVVAITSLAYEFSLMVFAPASVNKVFQLCDQFCQCGKGNLTVITYSGEQKVKGYYECSCLLSQSNTTTIFQKTNTYVISENYTCEASK